MKTHGVDGLTQRQLPWMVRDGDRPRALPFSLGLLLDLGSIPHGEAKRVSRRVYFWLYQVHTRCGVVNGGLVRSVDAFGERLEVLIALRRP